jgi:hypothetical protein
MVNLHNIERSGFRSGEYVGYAHGVWRITRGGLGWEAEHRKLFRRLSAPTLPLLSVALENFIPTTADTEALQAVAS